MSVDHTSTIDANKADLLDVLRVSDLLLTELCGEDVLDQRTKQMILAGGIQYEINERFLDWLKQSQHSTFTVCLEKLRDDQQNHIANLLGGTPGERPLTREERKQIQKNIRHLSEMIDVDSGLLTLLCSKSALSTRELQEVNSEKVKGDKAMKLLQLILQKSDRTFNCFVEALRETNQAYVISALEKGNIIALHAEFRSPSDLLDQFEEELVTILQPIAQQMTHLDTKLEPSEEVQLIQHKLQEICNKRIKFLGFKKGNSITIYFLCEDVEAKAELLLMFETRQLERILMKVFNLVKTSMKIPNAMIRVTMAANDLQILKEAVQLKGLAGKMSHRAEDLYLESTGTISSSELTTERREFEEQEKEFKDFCEQLLFRKFNEVAIYIGSFFELPLIYYFETSTDINCMVYRRNICAIKKDEPAPKEFKGTVLIIESEGSWNGYARLYSTNNTRPYTYTMDPEYRPYTYAIHQAHGPAYSQVLLDKSDISTYFSTANSCRNKWITNFEGLTSDIVEAIWCPNWPAEANEWKHRERKYEWPSLCTVDKIVNNGCFLVAKPHKKTECGINEYRFSFSEAELTLIHTWNPVQMYIYHILRLIKSVVVKKCGGKNMTFLTTYHFKTLMFWACEEKPEEFWLPDKTESSVQELILDMCEWLIEKRCDNYFMPSYNMLDPLTDCHNFEREVQFLIESVSLIDQYISNTVPVAITVYHGRLKDISVRLRNKLLFSLQLQMCFRQHIDSSKPGKPMHKPSSPIETSHLFRSVIANLFKCLIIQRFLGSAKNFEVKLDGMREFERSVERYFENVYEEHLDGFTYVDISLMDNGHEILAKVLKQNISSSDISDSAKGNRQEAKLFVENVEQTQRELWSCSTESVEQNYAESIVETLLDIRNNQVVQPFLFHAAAYQANFHWTFYGEESNDTARESHKKALDICNKWLCYAESLKFPLAFEFGCSLQGLPIIISNGWSMIFDRHAKVVLGFLSLVKAITSFRSLSSYKLSNEDTSSYVIVQVYPIDFLKYISYQCQLHLKDRRGLDYAFTHNIQNDIAAMFLFTAARISIQY